MNPRAALTMAALMCCPIGAYGQAPSNPPATVQAAPGSMTRIASRTLTLDAAIGAVAMSVFTVGTGSVAAAGLLTTGTIALGSVVYPVNEYLWDYYDPNTNLQTNGEAFDPKASLWRNTGKWATFKVGVIRADSP
jgi:uncharacterized membrane protein